MSNWLIDDGPPPPTRPKGRPPEWPYRLAGLMEIPGQWRRVDGWYDNNVGHYLRLQQRAGKLDSEYRFRTDGRATRSTGDRTVTRSGRCRLWACYGKPVEGPDPHDR